MVNARLLLLLDFFYFGTSAEAQTPPSIVEFGLIESVGDGCHTLSDPSNGIVCYDVLFAIDQPGWHLQSYNICMDYGNDSTVFSHASDASCHHQDHIGTDFNRFGKFRFTGSSAEHILIPNTPTIIHNFCLEIRDPSRTNQTPITPGGAIATPIVSIVNLVETLNPNNATAVEIPFGTPVILDLTSSVDEIDNVSLSISPNPFRQNLQIMSDNNIQSVEIFNVKGQSILMTEEINTTEVDLSVNKLETGLYFAHVKTTQGMSIQKIMKIE